jgi:hypothetical protein
MAAYTGGSSSVKYGYEGTLDVEGLISSAPTFATKSGTITNVFGCNQKVTNLTLNTSRIDLNKLGQIEPAKFAYGQQSGAVSIGYTWDDGDSYKILAALYKAPSGTAAGWIFPASSTTPLSHSTSPTAPHSLTTQIQVNTDTAVLTRTLKGCVVNSIGLSTSIGETVNGTCDMSFAEESTTDVADNGTFVTQTVGDQAGTPYTFAHGVLQTTTGNGSSLATVAEVQDVDVTWATNAEILYELGSHYGVAAFRKIFEITGRLRATFNDSKMLQYVIDQSIAGAEIETIVDNVSSVSMTLTFTNGTKSITIEFGGVSFGDHSTSGIEPSEVVFEEINWKAKAARIVVDTT